MYCGCSRETAFILNISLQFTMFRVLIVSLLVIAPSQSEHPINCLELRDMYHSICPVDLEGGSELFPLQDSTGGRGSFFLEGGNVEKLTSVPSAEVTNITLLIAQVIHMKV